jgi:hypothetical protein
LILPVVVLLLCGLIEVALVARDQLSLELAAREAARAASVSAVPATAASTAAHEAIALRPLDVTTNAGGDTVSVTVGFHHRVKIPLISALIDDVDLSATATMTWEPP